MNIDDTEGKCNISQGHSEFMEIEIKTPDKNKDKELKVDSKK